MSCIYLSSNGEKCNMFSKGEQGNPLGCSESGFCRVSDDPDPNVGCDTYEGVDVCIDCGKDSGVEGEECIC